MEYRAEIDGLRAVAIIPVVLLHAGYEYFSGGFVGVDVFFVISGYLITTIILTEKELGTFSLVNFYERRARRILPALFLVMFISLPFAWLWLIPSDMERFSKSLVAVPTFVSNILFWRESGYWDTANELKPLLHTWSLAVEEQYYILFPLFLMMMWRFRRRWILSSFIVISLFSLAAAEWAAYNAPKANFFLLTTRAWELAIGASIAFYFVYRRNTVRILLSNKFIDEVLGLAGLIMIGYAVYVFDETVPFPSTYALIPTIGTGLIIIFSSSQTLVGRLLGTKILVGIGLISYSTYLWHQPVFAFFRYKSIVEPSKLLYAMLVILSLILAYLSWRYIEKPFRKKDLFDRKIIFRFTIAGTALFIIIGSAGQYTKGFPNRFKLDKSIYDDFVFNDLRANCNKDFGNKPSDKKICTLGTTTNDNHLKFVIFGDSHAEAILPAFNSAAQSLNVKFAHLGAGGCPPLLSADIAKGNYGAGVCENIALRQFEYVKLNKIKEVFFVSRWSLYTDGSYDKKMKGYFLVDKKNNKLTKKSSRAVFIRSLENTIEAYRNIGAKIHVVYQIPQQKISPKSLYYKLWSSSLTDKKRDNILASKSISLNQSYDLQSYNRNVFERLALQGKIEVVNLDDIYCRSNICLIGDRNHSYYFDEDHVSVSGASLMVNEIKNILNSAIGDR